MSRRTPLFAGFLILGLSAFFLLPCSFADSSSKSSRKKEPIITWNTASSTSTISPGQRNAISLQFTSDHEIKHLCVGVSRSLQSLVRVRPSFFDHVKVGKTERVDVTIESRSSAVLGSFAGSIFLQEREKRERDDEVLSCSSPKFKTYLEGVRGKKASQSKMGSVVGSGC